MADFTLSELRHAFSGVKDNRGCAGVDGVTVEAFEKQLNANLQGIQYELSSGNYRPFPLLKILVANKNGEPRGLTEKGSCLALPCNRPCTPWEGKKVDIPVAGIWKCGNI